MQAVPQPNLELVQETSQALSECNGQGFVAFIVTPFGTYLDIQDPVLMQEFSKIIVRRLQESLALVNGQPQSPAASLEMQYLCQELRVAKSPVLNE